MKERIILGIVLLAFFAGSIQAWGPDGHKIVAKVAEAFLSPTAKQFVEAQLVRFYCILRLLLI